MWDVGMCGFASDNRKYKSHFSGEQQKLIKGSFVVAKEKVYCILYKTQGEVYKEVESCREGLFGAMM